MLDEIEQFWVQARRWRGRTGKKANDHVHVSEMKKSNREATDGAA
jgi:hypothetical protein